MRLVFPALVILTACSLLTACSTAPNPAVAPVREAPVLVSDATPRSAVSKGTLIAHPPIQRPIHPAARADVLTAGDIDDTRNLARFVRYQKQAARRLGWKQLNLSKPLMARLVGPTGVPAPGVRVTLHHAGARTPFYDGYSGVDGDLTAFPAVVDARRSDRITLRAFSADGAMTHDTVLRTNGQRSVVALPFDHMWQPDFLDLAFVVDTTGSMTDEIEWLIADLAAIVQRAKKAAPGVDVRLALVTYKSRGDRYTVKPYGFTKNLSTFRRWLRSELPTSGGGGYPEAVAASLMAAADLPWRRGQGERLIFQIGDEPPHRTQVGTYYQATRKAAQNGVQVFGLGASGTEARLEFLMRQGAVATQGRYLFLTDDSGVGRAHAEPTITCYRVTGLSNLVGRVLRSELTGRRVEAAPRDIVRSVGTYAGGVCRE